LLRIFSYNHPISLGLLLFTAVVLRLPSFHSGYFATDESFYLVAAERIVEGGTQYLDTWDNKPPVIVWVYTAFSYGFGDNALTAIRVFTCLYLFFCALLLNQLVIRNRMMERYPLLPGFIFLLLTSVPWYTQELNAELLMILPVIFAFQLIFNVAEDNRSNNNQKLLIAGLMLGLATMIKYQGLILFFAFLVGHIIVNPPRFSEYFSYAAGFILSVLTVFFAMLFSGALGAWWDIGVVYNLDYISIGRNPGEEPSTVFNLIQYGKLWGVFVLLGIIGMAVYRLNYFTKAIRLRRLEGLLFTWFIGGVLTIAAGGGRVYLHYFFILAAPLSVYVGIFFEQKIRRLFRLIALALALAGPAYTFGVFLSAAFPATFAFADQYFEPMEWVNGLRHELHDAPAVAAVINKSKVKNGILIMDDNPELYLKLGLPCATKYTNFSLAYYKISAFPHNEGRSLFSNEETLTNVYQAFKNDMPEYIIDPYLLFPHLQNKLPLLLNGFVADSSTGVTVWSRVGW
jgi:Dolichyl-phosphate-mannose-protein mannosyltransferase